MKETPAEIQNRVQGFECRFLVRNNEGLCVDWMAATKHDLAGFRQYVADRQSLRLFLKSASQTVAAA